MKIRTTMARTLLIAALIVAVVFVGNAAPGYALDNSGVNTKPTLKQLRDKYNDVGTPPLGEATFATPANTSAYTPATLTNASLTFAQKYINYMRYQAGLGEITLDSTVNANAAQGALILARLNTGLSHSPSVPSGVSTTAAAPGQYAAAASNLSYSSSWPSPDNMSIIKDAILGQMRDDSDSNLSSVGHRRWLLKPSTSTMGIGSALLVNRGDWNTAYTDIRIMNRNSNPPHQSAYGTIQTNNSTNYDFVAWPASGFMLNETFNSNTPWSIHIHEGKYQQIPDTAQVQITRVSDGKVWTINSSAPNTLVDKRINSNYFIISNNSNSGFTGEGHTLIFCPNPNELGSGKLRDDFNVKITGLKSSSGASKTIEYTVKFRGLKPNLDEMNVSLSQTSMEYTGQGLTPKATVNYDGTILTEGTDYQISYSNNINVTNGGATATIIGKGAYEGSVQKTFSITPKKISVPSAKTGLTYTGQPQNGVDTSDYYTVADGIKTDAGNYTAKLSLKNTTNTTWTDGTTGQKSVSWSISPKSLLNSMVTISPTSKEYNGSNQKPTVTVKDGNSSLEAGTDYTLTNNGGINVGGYTVSVAGKDNYEGTINKTFNITPRRISMPTAASGLIYNGQTQQGIASTTDYSVANGSGKNAGDYTATLNLTDTTNTTWADETTDQKAVVWSISPVSITDNMLTLTPLSNDYTGSSQKPEVKVEYNGTTLEKDTDYTLDKDGTGTGAGSYGVKVTGKNNFKGTVEKEYIITAKEIKDEMITVDSVTYNGSNQKPAVTVKDEDKTLVEGTDYTLTNNGGTNAGTYTVSVTGKGNYKGSNLKTYNISPLPIDDTDITVSDLEDYEYTGSVKVPSLAVKYSGIALEEGIDFMTTCSDNANVGQKTVTISGKGNFTGSRTATFNILPKSIASPDIVVEDIPQQVFKGEPVEPTPIVKYNGKTLTSNDFDLSYADNTAEGTGKVTIKGKDNFTGEKTLEFSIISKEDAEAQTQAEEEAKKKAEEEAKKAAAAARAKQKGSDGTALGAGASAECAEKAILASSSDEGPAGSKYAPLMLKSTKQGNYNIKLTWNAVKGAKTYVLYGNVCGKNNKMKRLTNVSGKTYNVTKIDKKLKKGTYHKFMIVALDAKKNVVSTSKVVHVATKGNKKAGNPTKVTTKKPKALKRGKTFKLKAKQSGKKVKKHRGLCYETSNPKIATVNKKGTIKAVGKGKCKVYIYAQNGVSKAVNVTVK